MEVSVRIHFPFARVLVRRTKEFHYSGRRTEGRVNVITREVRGGRQKDGESE